MTDQFGGEITSDDKLFAGLCYIPLIFPIISIIVLLLEDKKNRPYIRYHAVQSLAVGVVLWLITIVTVGCGSILLLIMFYWAYKAYQGEPFTIPFITDFIKNQGWA
jgi:uncharacterized membrane protein